MTVRSSESLPMNWPLGGLCGLTPRRRRQPRGGAARVESAFSTKGEVPTERGRRRHAMAVGALVPPGATRVVKLASQQCTQTPQNGAERPDPPICVHYCDPEAPHNPSPRHNSVHKRPKTARRGPILPFVYTIAIPRPPTTQAHGLTVYTNAPKRRRGAIFADLCTLLRPRACPQLLHGPTVYTNAPKRRREARSSHLCTLLRSQGHSQPKPTAQQCTQMPQNGPERPF